MKRNCSAYFVILVLLLVGCASYKPTALPSPHGDHAVDDDFIELEVGSQVRVALVSGVVYHGEVARYSDAEVEIVRVEDFGGDKLVINKDEIESIEAKWPRNRNSIIIGLAIIGSLVLVTLFYLAQSL